MKTKLETCIRVLHYVSHCQKIWEALTELGHWILQLWLGMTADNFKTLTTFRFSYYVILMNEENIFSWLTNILNRT